MTMHPDVKALLEHIDKMRPSNCCRAKLVRENNGRAWMSCEDECPWARLDLLVANVSVYIDEDEWEVRHKPDSWKVVLSLFVGVAALTTAISYAVMMR